MPKGSAYVLILVILGLAMLAGSIGGVWERFSPAAYADDVEPVRPGQENAIRRAVFADGRLWLLSDSGELWTVREGAPGAERIATDGAALDVCAEGGRLIVATAARERARGWTLERRDGARWATIATVPAEQEGLVAIACDAERLSVLTSRRLVEIEAASRRVVPLTNRVPRGPIGVMLATPAYLFLGLNAGEWGGGLQRIERRTGQVREMQSREGPDICAGPLNSDCDPVNGIAVSPWRPNCVIAAVGLAHAMWSGRLLEVCGERITVLHREPCPSGQDIGRCTMPFFGLVRTGGGVLAVAPGDLVNMERGGTVTHPRAPEYRSYGPFKVAFDPSYVLVATSVNQRHSVSGMTPLIVAR